MRVEYRVGEVVGGALEFCRDRPRFYRGRDIGIQPEGGREIVSAGPGRTAVWLRIDLVEAEPHGVIVNLVQQDAAGPCRGDDRGRAPRSAHRQRVEVVLVCELEPCCRESRGEGFGGIPNLQRDALQTLRAVVDRIHRGHHGQQHLRCADIGRGLLATDVLLARLQGESIGGVADGIL